MAEDGPPLFRPVPRRPFAVPRMEPTPPPSDMENDDDYNPNSYLTASHFRNSGFSLFSQNASPLSRGHSTSDLTSSTLAGIYSAQDEEETPYDTGVNTPFHRPSVADVSSDLKMRQKSRLSTGATVAEGTAHKPREGSTLSSTTLGAGLLFGLGVGFGILLSRLQDGSRWSILSEGKGPWTGYDLPYLAFWGASGVALGALLPWFDQVWERQFAEADQTSKSQEDTHQADDENLSTDWTLVMRAIGAFVGIVFALRKLAWSSTLQVSISLALVNPLLWWIIDRSAAGLIISTAVGVGGSVVLLGVNPEMMPAPSNLLHLHSAVANRTISGQMYGEESSWQGKVDHSTLETGVWMISVLFCSCVCFGNIGRRLAWNRNTDVKGRWGGLRA